MGDQQGQCAIEDRGDVTERQGVPGKCLCTPQLFVRFARQRHLQHVEFRRQRRHDGRTEPAHNGRRRLARVQFRDQFLNLPLASVPRGRQHLFVIHRGQNRREQADRSEREVASFEGVEHLRKTARRSGGFDAVVCRAFRQMQHAGAVGEE